MPLVVVVRRETRDVVDDIRLAVCYAALGLRSIESERIIDYY